MEGWVWSNMWGHKHRQTVCLLINDMVGTNLVFGARTDNASKVAIACTPSVCSTSLFVPLIASGAQTQSFIHSFRRVSIRRSLRFVMCSFQCHLSVPCSSRHQGRSFLSSHHRS